VHSDRLGETSLAILRCRTSEPFAARLVSSVKQGRIAARWQELNNDVFVAWRSNGDWNSHVDFKFSLHIDNEITPERCPSRSHGLFLSQTNISLSKGGITNRNFSHHNLAR
jgi:hypothetical protein